MNLWTDDGVGHATRQNEWEDLSGGALDEVLKQVKALGTRCFYCRDNKFELSLREDPKNGRWYMTVLNPDVCNTVEDEIRFVGPKVIVRDLELQKAGPIPATRQGNATVFKMRLAPGEGAMLELAKKSWWN